MSAGQSSSASVKRLLEEMGAPSSMSPDTHSGSPALPESGAAMSSLAERLAATGLLVGREPQRVVAGRGNVQVAVYAGEPGSAIPSDMPVLRFPARMVELFPEHVLKDIINDIDLLEALCSG